MGISQMRLKWLKRFPNGNREFPKQKDIKKFTGVYLFAKILMYKRMAIGMSFSISSKFSIDNRKRNAHLFPSVIIVII